MFNDKHSSYKSTAICDMPPSGPINAAFVENTPCFNPAWLKNPKSLAEALAHFSLCDVVREPPFSSPAALLCFFFNSRISACRTSI